MRSRLLMAFILWEAVVVVEGRALAQPLQRVVFPYSSRSICPIDLFIAQDRGFFRREGLEVQLVQARGTTSIAATLSGEAHALASVGSGIRAIERGAQMKVLAVGLSRALFWLVTRPELKSFADLKGKILGTTTFGGSQHIAGIRMLRKAGLDPNKDVTLVLAGDVPTQLQALVNNSIQIGILSPPAVILARDKFKMNVHASAIEDVVSFQCGIAVLEKNLTQRRGWVKSIVRARTGANRYFWEDERGTSEVLAKYLNVDLPTAVESYRLSRPAFTTGGIPTDEDIDEFLKMDAEILKLPKPFPASKVFDFTLQREVNQELGIKQ